MSAEIRVLLSQVRTCSHTSPDKLASTEKRHLSLATASTYPDLMNRLTFILVLAFLFQPHLCFAENTKKSRIIELDAFWAEISRSVKEGDFEAYAASCHPEGVLVSGSKKSSSPLSVALARWKKEFVATKSKKLKTTVEFRFSQRLSDETTAHETGIFLYSSVHADGKYSQEYIHFEELLVKKNGHWKTLMEYQKYKVSPKEWDALGQNL